MKWARPLEQFIELGLVLWLFDLFIRPLFAVVNVRKPQRGSTRLELG
jgi:hypothetical protein